MKLLLKRILSYLPSKLPTGLSEFEAWVKSIMELTGQIADETSMKFALASILIHADAKHGSLPKKYFVNRLVKSAANQVASQVFQDIKTQQVAAQVEAAKSSAEVTAQTPEAVTPNEQDSQPVS